MIRSFLIITSFLITSWASAQDVDYLKSIQPHEEFENILVQKLAEDELQSAFVIWVKKGVKAHHHVYHTENIYVISGKAEMTIGDKSFRIKPGDYLNIPKGTSHSVTQVFGKKPLKVLSIQAPKFDGDRVFE